MLIYINMDGKNYVNYKQNLKLCRSINRIKKLCKSINRIYNEFASRRYSITILLSSRFSKKLYIIINQKNVTHILDSVW